MRLLAIDTSTKNFSVAVSENEKILKYRNVRLDKMLSSAIIPNIKRILKDAGVSLQQLDGFAVGLGPGSFTSLRVGLATIKGLAFATGKPVVGISSLDVLARNSKQKDVAQICAVCDARRSMVYACLYERKGNDIKQSGDYLLMSIDDLLKRIKGKVVFIGDGVSLVKEHLNGSKTSRNIEPYFAEGKDAFPQAKQLVGLVLERFYKEEYDSLDTLTPLYLYRDDCQVRGV